MFGNFRKVKFTVPFSVFVFCLLTLLLSGCRMINQNMGIPINNLPCKSTDVKDRLVDYFNKVPKRLSIETKEAKSFQLTTDWYQDEPRPPRRDREVQYIIDIKDNSEKTDVFLTWTGRAKGIREETYQNDVDISEPKDAPVLVSKITNICGA
jgi:hypothetical protein